MHGIHSTDGHLPNPYHSGEFGQTWFHGTIGEYDGNPDPGKSFAAMQGPSNGCGGPQMNKLLGVHFSPLHDVAQGFARPSHSTAHGRIFHARLKMSNPIHFADENDLLRHIWDTTMRGDHFHDEQHDERMQWNYGGGSTREGITRRMDAARGLPPGSLRRESPKSAMESYLQFHPRQKEIAEAYVHHLRYEGHDGITYGNTVEGPSLHHCAIAFDPKTIEVTHVDRMHPTPSPYLKDEDKAQASPRDGEVSHDHIRAIHGEPEDFLREVERYHRGGTARGDSGYSFFGPNTGKGEWTFHHANKYFPGYTDTPYTQEHAWLPHGKVFAPGKGTLDPRLFDPEGLMRASVRKVIMDRLTFVLKDRWPDWEDWSRVYLAGSEASEWWGNNDFDTLIGVNYAAARKAHSEFKPMTDDEISDAITSVFRADYNDEEWTAPWDGEVWHLTGYVNPDSWNIRKIKPYAAYDMTRSKWIVKPPHLGKEWGPEKWPEGIWEEVEAYLALIKAIGTLPEPDQSRQGALLYDTLHGDRQRAFGPNGYGWNDPGNVIWKALDLHPDHPLEKLIAWKHQAVSAEKEQAA